MPDYKHLEDGTPVTAEEFNTRFDTLMGGDKGVNAVTPDMLALGALRHNQIPALVGKAGESEADLSGGFSKETKRTFISGTGTKGVEIEARTLISGAPTSWGLAYRHQFPQPISNTDADVIIVLANAHVNRFAPSVDQMPDAAFVAYARERLVGIAFRLVAEIETEWADGTIDLPVDYPLPASERGISPGVTIDYTHSSERSSGHPMVNGSAVLANYDIMVFKDAALRSVLVIPDGGTATHRVVAIRLDAGLYGDGSIGLTGRIDKMNLTAIPLHTKVDKHGGS